MKKKQVGNGLDRSVEGAGIRHAIDVQAPKLNVRNEHTAIAYKKQHNRAQMRSPLRVASETHPLKLLMGKADRQAHIAKEPVRDVRNALAVATFLLISYHDLLLRSTGRVGNGLDRSVEGAGRRGLRR